MLISISNPSGYVNCELIVGIYVKTELILFFIFGIHRKLESLEPMSTLFHLSYCGENDFLSNVYNEALDFN